MIITYFRSSSYNGWSICPQQYFMTYVLGMPQPSGKKAEMGTILHKVMECLAHGKLAVQNGENSFTDEVSGTMPISEDTLFNPQLVERLFEKSFNYYSAPTHSIHPYTDKDKETIWKWCCDTLEYYDGMFDPRKRDIVAPEPHFDFEIDEPWAEYEYVLPNGEKLEGKLRVKGTIDLVTRIASDVYEVVDWKSGECKNWGTGQEKHFEDFTVDPQLRIYHWALQKLYPDVKTFAMTINYVRTKGPYTVAYDESDMEDTMKMLRKRFEAIKANLRPKMKSPSNKHWFCKYVCWYGSQKNPDNIGKERTLCQQIGDKTRRRGINTVMLEDTAPGHQIGHYQNPGS